MLLLLIICILTIIRFKKCKIGNYGNVTCTEDRKYPVKIIIKHVKECYFMEVHSLMQLFKRALMSVMLILAECLEQVSTLQSTAQKAINTSTEWEGLVAHHIKINHVIHARGICYYFQFNSLVSY